MKIIKINSFFIFEENIDQVLKTKLSEEKRLKIDFVIIIFLKLMQTIKDSPNRKSEIINSKNNNDLFIFEH